MEAWKSTSSTTSSKSASHAPVAKRTVPVKQESHLAMDAEAHLRKLYPNDEKKVKAGLAIRHWLKGVLLRRRERRIESQLLHLQQQHQLMLTNPQHFQDCELMSLIELSPLSSSTAHKEVADPFRFMTEVTDALLRSEIRKHAHFASNITDRAIAHDFKQQLQRIETGRREILQVYAQRVKLLNAQASTKPTQSHSKGTENADNSKPGTVHQKQEKKRKARKNTSIRWADAAGHPLTHAQTFDEKDLIVTGKTI